jgi:hypothetical protein
MKVFDDVNSETIDKIFEELCATCQHLEIVQCGDRYFQICFGPEHDSWVEVEKPEQIQ